MIISLSILSEIIITGILLIRKNTRIKVIITGVLSIILMTFSIGITLKTMDLRYSVCPFGNKYPGSIAVKYESYNWEVGRPQEYQMDINRITTTIMKVENYKFTRSILIVKNGKLVVEKYFNKTKENDACQLMSATKSITSALIGIAIEKKFIKSVDQTLKDFFPEYFKENENQIKSNITIRNLLTMQAGYSTTDNNMTGTNWTKSIINYPLTYHPGTKFCYANCESHLLSCIIAKSSGMKVEDFAEKYLFHPIKSTIALWSASPDGINKGCTELYLTPRDMARFGYLYLKEGTIDGEQVISKEWVKLSLVDYSINKGRSDKIPLDGYGFQWWSKNIAGKMIFAAAGLGCQLIMIIPELDMVIVNVNEPNVSEHDGEINTVITLEYIKELILASS
jgi:CubicO group peptidase (beta-lactamase class C family)